MPRFLVYAPDLPNVLEKRMAVRPQHVARAKPDQENGINSEFLLSHRVLMLTDAVYGGAMLPPAGSAARNAKLPPGQVNYAGSFMVMVFDNVDAVWDRLKEDVYWKSDIWDKERVIVEELID